MNNTAVAQPGTQTVSIALHGTENHFIGNFTLVIGDLPAVLPKGPDPIHIPQPTMDGILATWRANGGTRGDRPSDEIAAIFDLIPAFFEHAAPARR